jgi:hypothetical protein
METTPAISRPSLDLGDVFTRAAEADLSRPLPFALLSVVYLLVRAPFLDYGYGTDPDAWRVALTGQFLVEKGQYFPSRLPGNPLHELVMAPFVPLGWVAADLVTALAALAGVYIFARIVAETRVPHAAIVTIGFAFAPLLFINSIATMDYMWTLTMVLAAYFFTLKRMPLWAGVFCGLAVGFRIQSAVIGLPLAYLMWRRGELRQVLPFGFAAAGVAALAFAPVLVVYGVRFFNFYDAPVEYQVVLRLLGKEALGVIGGLAVLIGLALSIRRLSNLPRDIRSDYHLGVWLLFLAVYTVSFLRLPHEIAYMIPVFPFGFLFLARYLTRPVLTFVVAAIILAGIVDITTPSDDLSLSAFRGATLGKGLLLSNVETMDNQKEFIKDIMEAPVPDHSVVLAGFVYPQLAMRERDHLDLRILQHDYGAISMLSDRGEAVDTKRDIHYVWLLTYDAFTALRSQGYSFFLVPDAAGGTAALYDYRPSLFGATFLPLRHASPSSGKGTASTDR